MVQVNLKLKLSKTSFGIKIAFNTFEKATYDQYLASSLALNTIENALKDTSAYKYIDDITGSGSLNAHFKHLYDAAKKLTKDQLKDVMSNSMYPILKIDKSNNYDYYPELNISIFKGKIYDGDFGKYPDLIERLYIQEKVIEHEVFEVKSSDKPEPYSVILGNEQIKIKITNTNEWIDLPESVFSKIFVNELDQINKFEGIIHKGAEGTGWFTLTNSVINNMYSIKNYYYEQGDHYLIRNDDVRKTMVSEIAGFYIYKEEIIPYQNNKELCEKVVNILKQNKTINEFKTKSLINILTYVDELIAQDIINYILNRKTSKELSLFGLDLLIHGVEKKWDDEALKSFMEFADSNNYSLIYKANPKLISDVQILSNINFDYLTTTHKKKVEEYKKDIEAKITAIKRIIGDVTASGVREEIKKLKSSKESKRFSKLANNYIGHSTIVFDKATPKELDKYLKDITEMQDLMKMLLKEIREQK